MMLTWLHVGAEDTSTTDRDWIGEAISSQYSNFQSVTVYPCPADKSILAVYCEHDHSWWGHMRVFRHSGDKVEWAATFPPEYIEARGHYVVSCRWTSFEMLSNPVLELTESTHRGNGSIWLLELNGKEFRLLLHTRVMGRYWPPEPEFAVPPDGEAIFEKNLKVEYRKADGDDHVSVWLTGNVQVTGVAGEELPARGYQQQCTWNSDKRIFEAKTPKVTEFALNHAETPAVPAPDTKPSATDAAAPAENAGSATTKPPAGNGKRNE